MLSETKQAIVNTLLLLSCADKKVTQRSSRPTLHSLINCICSTLCEQTRYAQTMLTFVVVSQTLIVRSANGRLNIMIFFGNLHLMKQ